MLIQLNQGLQPLPVFAQNVKETMIVPGGVGNSPLLINLPPTTDFKFTHLGLEDGLSQSAVGVILQDSRGFMWFGTQDGLNRYDGYNFVVYRNDPNELTSLGGNQIRAIVEDSSGVLWVGTSGGGLNKYDPNTDTFVRYMHDPDNPNSLKNDMVWKIWQDEVGLLWLYTEDGWLTEFNPISETFTHYQFTRSTPSNLDIAYYETKSIYQDKTGIFWLGNYKGGLASFDRKTGQFSYFFHDPDDAASIGAGGVTNIYEDETGNLWISTTEGGLNLLDRESKRFKRFLYNSDDPYSISDNNCQQIYQDHTKNYWVATSKGLNLFDPGTGNFIRYLKDPSNPYALSNDNINTIYEDRGGILWLGTDGGINKLDRGAIQFSHYRNLPGDLNSLSTSYIYSIYEDQNGILWVGGDDGVLNRFDRNRNQVTHYEPDADNPNALNSSWSVSAIYEDSTGTFWVGTFNGGLHTFDRKTEQFQRYLHSPYLPHSIASDIILAIYEDSAGTLWVGTDGGGLNRFDRQNQEFYSYTRDFDNLNNPIPGNVRSIYEDRFGLLWLTSWYEGLTCFDPQTEQFVNYRHDPGNTQSLSNDLTYAVHEDQEGVLWIGTDGGLDRFDRQNATFKHYTVKDGLPNNVIYAIMEDESRNLWVSTNRGVSEFNPRTEIFHNYNVFDGLQSDELNQNAFFQSDSREMFFGGVKGLNAFYPEQITRNPYRPPVILTDLQIFNQSVAIGTDSILQKSIWDTEKIILNYDQDVFSLAFAALSYAAPEANQYRYKLEGFDDKWNEVDAKRRFATYTNIPPGDYIFLVQAANEDGVWNEEGVSLNITITPPWWGTWWFRASVIAALLSLILIGYRWRLRSIHQRNLELELLVTERTAQLKAVNKELEAFAYSVSHDLRAPLRHIDGFIDILRHRAEASLDDKSRHYMDVIDDSARKMGMLIDDLLSFSRMGRSEMSKAQVDLNELIQEILREFGRETEGRNIQWKVSSLPTVTGDWAMLRVVLVNLIANALKFTRPRDVAQIEIGTQEKDDAEVVIFVRDNGVGFDMNYADKLFGVFQRLHRQEDFEGTGIGLANAQRVINRHGGNIWVEAEIEQGATFYFSLPK
jgi:ligand-binding sensor domain-containing protein/signal transduction histidine kinase